MVLWIPGLISSLVGISEYKGSNVQMDRDFEELTEQCTNMKAKLSVQIQLSNPNICTDFSKFCIMSQGSVLLWPNFGGNFKTASFQNIKSYTVHHSGKRFTSISYSVQHSGKRFTSILNRFSNILPVCLQSRLQPFALFPIQFLEKSVAAQDMKAASQA